MDNPEIPTAKPVEPSQGGHHEPASSRAITALVLGILSIVCTGFLTGIPAIIIGNMELKAIKSGHSTKSSEGLARVGFILGIVGTAITCIITLVSAVIMLLAFTLGGIESMRAAVGS